MCDVKCWKFSSARHLFTHTHTYTHLFGSGIKQVPSNLFAFNRLKQVVASTLHNTLNWIRIFFSRYNERFVRPKCWVELMMSYSPLPMWLVNVCRSMPQFVFKYFIFSNKILCHSWHHHHLNCKVSNTIGNMLRTFTQRIRPCPKFTSTIQIYPRISKRCYSCSSTKNENRLVSKQWSLPQMVWSPKQWRNVNALILCWTIVRSIYWPTSVLWTHQSVPVCAFSFGCVDSCRACPIYGWTIAVLFNPYKSSSITAAMGPDSHHHTKRKKSFICWRWLAWFAKNHCYCICFCQHTNIHWLWPHWILHWAWWKHQWKIHCLSTPDWRQAFGVCRLCSTTAKTQSIQHKVMSRVNRRTTLLMDASGVVWLVVIHKAANVTVKNVIRLCYSTQLPDILKVQWVVFFLLRVYSPQLR